MKPPRSAACALTAALLAGVAHGQLPTQQSDFFMPGTQPLQSNPPEPWMIQDPLLSGFSCDLCHRAGESGASTLKPQRWRGSMHAHSFRDPIFQAAFVIANQDAPGAGEFCLRCHAPRAWIEGRATPPTGNPDGSSLFFSDIDEGVTCIACHRMVDPDYKPGVSPADDLLILNALAGQGLLPDQFGNAQMVIDPMDVRRGPFDTPAAPHLWAKSPFHQTGDMCGTCHDVSNPLLLRQGGPTPAAGDTYLPDAFGAPHSTGSKHDQFPEQRTYSEWLNSAFATTPGGIFIPDDINPALNRFGGNRQFVSSCVDCHMPDVTARACSFGNAPIRPDMPYHNFAAANTLAIDLLLHLYGPAGADEFDQFTIDSLTRTRSESLTMLRKATDAQLTQHGPLLNVRIINQCGHKLLTGMPEGRRMWLNVRYFSGPSLIAERGAYDAPSATLDETNTKVYEAVFGIDAAMAALTGRPPGKSFNLMLVNTILKDNRIPPRGFANAAFEAVQAHPVAYDYDDGQHWDDTRFCIPPGATRAEVRFYYQVASREYIEFLRDENTTDNRGQILYDAWAATGRSAPVLMDEVSINLAPFVAGDVSGDGAVGFADVSMILANWGASGGPAPPGDADCSGVVDFGDINVVLANWGAAAP